jgi:hypothetical protein
MMHYGEISKDEVRQKAMTYLGTNDQQEKDSDMIFHCLRKTISDAVFAKLTTEPERYTFIIYNKDKENEDDDNEDPMHALLSL